jgi:hypothetical protein
MQRDHEPRHPLDASGQRKRPREKEIAMRMIATTVLGLSLVAGGSAAALTTIPMVVTAPEVTKGKVASINDEESSFTVATSNDEEVTVKFDNKTVWVLDNEVSTRDAVLKQDREVSVTHAEGVATRVEAKKSS